MSASFRISSLASETFARLFELDEPELRRLGARRVTADAKPGYPCRVSLRDAEIGEELMLLPYRHHDVPSPYRALGPIFVSKGVGAAKPAVGELPEMLEHRPISVRAYDGAGMMVDAAIAEGGGAVRRAIGRLFENEAVAYLHLHNAAPGCFACRVERA